MGGDVQFDPDSYRDSTINKHQQANSMTHLLYFQRSSRFKNGVCLKISYYDCILF